MSKIVRVRYKKSALKPLEPLEFREGEELTIFIRESRVGEVVVYVPIIAVGI